MFEKQLKTQANTQAGTYTQLPTFYVVCTYTNMQYEHADVQKKPNKSKMSVKHM